MECARSQHSLGTGMGRLALRAVAAGSPIAGMDRLVVSLHGGVTGAHRLALQQHGEERIRRGAISRHQQRQYGPVSQLLRSAYHRPDHRIRGRSRHSRMGTTNVSSIPKCLSGARCISLLSDGCANQRIKRKSVMYIRENDTENFFCGGVMEERVLAVSRLFWTGSGREPSAMGNGTVP